jgi:hypothetical protein
MATQESLDIIDANDPTRARYADYMLSRIFDAIFTVCLNRSTASKHLMLRKEYVSKS